MSKTHGGRTKRFQWSYQQDQVIIQNETGKTHVYSLGEISSVLTALFQKFRNGWFPLANHVQKMN